MEAVMRKLIITLLLSGLFVSCSCQRNPQADGTPATTDHPESIRQPAHGSSVQGSAATVALQQRHDQAFYDAVDAVHRHVSALAARDEEKVRSGWINARPDAQGEVALADPGHLRSLRIENGTPKALDKEDVPEVVEIPVRLRASSTDGSQVLYTGYYRLRHVGENWLLTSASVFPELK
jgi:hypothetical protein